MFERIEGTDIRHLQLRRRGATMLKYSEDKRCVSVIELLLVRNRYALGCAVPDPTVPVSFTLQQRKTVSKAFSFHRLKHSDDEVWQSFQSAVLNGQNRTPIITTVEQARLVAEKVVNTGQTTGCCCMHMCWLSLVMVYLWQGPLPGSGVFGGPNWQPGCRWCWGSSSWGACTSCHRAAAATPSGLLLPGPC